MPIQWDWRTVSGFQVPDDCIDAGSCENVVSRFAKVGVKYPAFFKPIHDGRLPAILNIPYFKGKIIIKDKDLLSIRGEYCEPDPILLVTERQYRFLLAYRPYGYGGPIISQELRIIPRVERNMRALEFANDST